MRRPARRMESQAGELFPNASKIRQLSSQGIDVIKMGVGSPSFDTPGEIKESTKKALDDGYVHYDDPAGLKEFRDALSSKLERFNHIKADPDSEVLVTPGSAGGAFSAIMSLIDEGDEVINFNPSYTAHDSRVTFAGGSVKYAPLLGGERGYRLDAVGIESAVTARTKAILLVNPHNPLGRVFTPEELTILAKVAVKHDLVVLSDETYEYFTYDNRKHTSIASLPGMRDRTVSLFTFTKAYAMDGWRLGYATGPESVVSQMRRIETLSHTHVNVFVQKGAVEAVERDVPLVTPMVREDERRRDLVVSRLRDIEGVNCDNPEGGLYVFPDFTYFGRSSRDLQADLLAKARVSTVSGASFGSLGEGHLRLCFGADTFERIEEGLGRIGDVLRNLQA